MNKTAILTNESLHKMPVISLNDGARIGYVEDLLIDPLTLHLAALVVKGEKGESVLPMDHIKNIGEDAITVESVSATQSGPNSLPGLRPFSELRGLNVVDSAGSHLGELHDISIDPTKAVISSIEVRSGGILGLGAHGNHLSATELCSFGPDIITVNAKK